MLRTCVQLVPAEGPAVQAAPLVAGKHDEHLALLRAVRNAGGLHDGKRYAEGYVLSTRGVLKHVRFNPNFAALVSEPALPQEPEPAADADPKEAPAGKRKR